MFRHGLIRKRNWVTREIRGVTIFVNLDLDDCGTPDIIHIANRLGGRSHLRAGIIDQRVNRAIYCFRIDQRLISLDIHDDLGIEITSNFGDAIGAARMIIARHSGFKTRSVYCLKDSSIVGGHNYSGNGTGGPGPFCDP